MCNIILVTGGARSGKSRLAEEATGKLGKHIAYLATAIPFDEGMRDRIAKHKKDRPADWVTFEYPVRIHEALDALEGFDGVLIDCITVLINNYLFEKECDWDRVTHEQMDTIERRIISDLKLFISGLRQRQISAVLVTNEVGLGIVPENRLARLYRDMAGRVNQELGNLADEVYLVVCGQRLKIK